MFHPTEPVVSMFEKTRPKEQFGCPACGAGPLRNGKVSSVFWRGDQALMVQGIPAIVCESCGEDFISDDTAIALDWIKGSGFSKSGSGSKARLGAVRYMTVPVFEFDASPDAAADSSRDALHDGDVS